MLDSKMFRIGLVGLYILADGTVPESTDRENIQSYFNPARAC
jgi:hypothetical protein